MEAEKKKIRVLLSNLGLGGHDIGIKIVAQALREAGMEVIYLGINQMPEQIVRSAIQEAVDIIGLSSMSGVHKDAVPRLMELMTLNNANDIPVVIGGIIPKKDFSILKEAGVKGIFPPGSMTRDMVEFIRDLLASKV